MNLQPTLIGKLLTLHPLKQEDFEDLYQAASDPQIWTQHPKSNRHERAAFNVFFDEAMKTMGALVVIENSSKKIIGSSRYYNYDPKASEITIGATFLERKYWGGVFNKEMKKLMISHALEFVDTIEFHLGSENQRSQIRRIYFQK